MFIGKGVAINYWLQQSSSIEQTIIMKPSWNDDPRTDPTMVQIFKYINTRQDNRSILWIYSNSGRTGKSTMLTYMANKLKVKGIPVFMSSGGKDSDISNIYMEEPYCFFDFPRSEAIIPYGFIEQLKNSNVTSTKYQGSIKKPRDRHGNLVFPWVIVVANQAPSMERISKDRCKVICLDTPGHAHDLPVIPDQEHRIPEQEPDHWNRLGNVDEKDSIDWKWENPLNGTGKPLIDKRGEHGKKEEVKRIMATIPVVVQTKTNSNTTIRKEHKSDDSDDDSLNDVINPYPANKSDKPSPKGKLLEIKKLINKNDSKRSGPSTGLGLGGGPPPQSFHTMLTNKIKNKKPIETKAPPPSPTGSASSYPDNFINLVDDDEPIIRLPIKQEGGKPPKRTLINKGVKRVRGGGPDADEEPTQLPDAYDGYDDHTKIEEDDDYSETERAELERAYQEAEACEEVVEQLEHENRLKSAKKQKVTEVSAAEEAGQILAALIADKKAKAKEKQASKHLSLQARLAEES